MGLSVWTICGSWSVSVMMSDFGEKRSKGSRRRSLRDAVQSRLQLLFQRPQILEENHRIISLESNSKRVLRGRCKKAFYQSPGGTRPREKTSRRASLLRLVVMSTSAAKRHTATHVAVDQTRRRGQRRHRWRDAARVAFRVLRHSKCMACKRAAMSRLMQRHIALDSDHAPRVNAI